MKLYRCMHDIEMMCREKGRQLLLAWFFNYLPSTKFHIVNRVCAITLSYLVYELSALDLVPYSKLCPGHNSLTIWNIFMKLYRCMHGIETMCHDKGRQLLLVWFFNYLPLT